jgi:hypothetical protein
MPAARHTSLAEPAVGRPRPRSTPGVLQAHYTALLWSLLAAGLAVRVLFMATANGNRFDLGSLQLVAHTLVHHPSQVYAVANLPGQTPHWPYLPGYLPIVLLLKGLSGASGIAFRHLIRLPVVLSDLAIAWVVQDFVRARGNSEGAALGAAALVALGPSFIAISAVHGQIDAAAILPAVIALSVWERAQPAHRAWIAGLLIGTGAAIKLVPGLMVLALAPSARSRRELATLVGATLVVPLLSTLPMVAAAGTGWIGTILHYHGGSGLGGLSLVAQPDLPLNWFHVGSDPLTGLSAWLIRHGGVIAVAAIFAAAAFLGHRRTPAPLAAVVIWLTVYAFGVAFFMQYMVWGLPFLLMAGFRREVLALQLVLFAPVLVIYHGVHAAWAAWVFYVVPMLVVWAALTAGLAVLCVRLARRPWIASGST